MEFFGQKQQQCYSLIQNSFNKLKNQQKTLLSLLSKRSQIQHKYSKEIKQLSHQFMALKSQGNNFDQSLITFLIQCHQQNSKLSKQIAKQLLRQSKNQLFQNLTKQLKPLLLQLKHYQKQCSQNDNRFAIHKQSFFKQRRKYKQLFLMNELAGKGVGIHSNKYKIARQVQIERMKMQQAQTDLLHKLYDHNKSIQQKNQQLGSLLKGVQNIFSIGHQSIINTTSRMLNLQGVKVSKLKQYINQLELQFKQYQPCSQIKPILNQLNQLSKGAQSHSQFKIMLFRPDSVLNRQRLQFSYFFSKQFPQQMQIIKNAIKSLNIQLLQQEELLDHTPQIKLASIILLKCWTGLDLTLDQIKNHQQFCITQSYKDSFLMIFSQFRICKQTQVNQNGWKSLEKVMKIFCYSLLRDQQLLVGRRLIILLFSYNLKNSKDCVSSLVKDTHYYQNPQFWLSSLVQNIMQQLTRNPCTTSDQKDKKIHQRNVVIPQLTTFAANINYFLNQKIAKIILQRAIRMVQLSHYQLKQINQASRLQL